MSDWIKWNLGECYPRDLLGRSIDIKWSDGTVTRNHAVKCLVENDEGRYAAYRLSEQTAEEAYEDTDRAIPYKFPNLDGEKSALNVQVAGEHYKKLKIQPIEYIHANNIPFPEGSAIKYLTRWRDKGGIADLQKAKHFIEMLIELETKSSNG